MPKAKDVVTISRLTKDELITAELLFDLMCKLYDLSPESRRKVYQRWQILYLILPGDAAHWERELERIHDDSGQDRRKG